MAESWSYTLVGGYEEICHDFIDDLQNRYWTSTNSHLEHKSFAYLKRKKNISGLLSVVKDWND